ncbi:MAG: NAD(P)H-dependent oxidoreductase, partial [Clostridia bacterium]|nr:NAD(P)H-dependent oxidoreductase [Clostridia bacterium]
MKVLLINGSPNPNGCTFTALDIIAKRLNEQEIETQLIQVGKKPIIGCV